MKSVDTFYISHSHKLFTHRLSGSVCCFFFMYVSNYHTLYWLSLLNELRKIFVHTTAGHTICQCSCSLFSKYCSTTINVNNKKQSKHDVFIQCELNVVQESIAPRSLNKEVCFCFCFGLRKFHFICIDFCLVFTVFTEDMVGDNR